MAVIKNYYKILGVEYDASEQDIRNAYRVLAKKYHPDLNQGDESAAAKFRNISEAQDILLDVAERSQHDILLQSKGVIMPHIEKQKEEARKQAEENAKANAEKSSSGDALKDELIRQARKKAQQRAQKDPRKMSKAERNAYAMKKVNESKAFKKKAIVLSSIAGGILVVGLALFFIITAILSTVTVTFVYNYNNEIVVEKVERNALIPTPTYYPTRDG